MKKSIFYFLCLAIGTSGSYALPTAPQYPFYLGVLGGYGSTTWQALVPDNENQGPALNMSTPVYVTEGGVEWGVYGGYQLIPMLALEFGYTRYPNAKVNFHESSIYAGAHGGDTSLNTHTELVTLLAKLSIPIPKTDIQVFSAFGPAGVHRHDRLMEHWRLNPSFSFGAEYEFTPRVFGAVVANYTSGYGESELNPAQDFIPFLYSIALSVGYRF